MSEKNPSVQNTTRETPSDTPAELDPNDVAYRNTLDDEQNDVSRSEQETTERSESEVLDDFIAERVGEAMRNCEFESTPELQESIEGFYHDHFYLAGAIKAVAEGRFDSDLFQTILDDPRVKEWERKIGRRVPTEQNGDVRQSPNAATAAYRLAVMAQEIVGSQEQLSVEQMETRHLFALKQCRAAVSSVLLQETSVGITTVGDPEAALVDGLSMQLAEVVDRIDNDDARWDALRRSDPRSAEDKIKDTQYVFWSETRHAGQLLFHGTGDLGAIHGKGLMSRNEQVRRVGHMRAQTAVEADTVGLMHSNVPHFSEFYSGEYASDVGGGTLAIPLARVIEQAPFARDNKYGLVVPKSGAVLDRVPSATRKSVGSVGVGTNDDSGSSGEDRVFFASADEESETLPDNYVLSMGDKSKRPATYIVDQPLNERFKRAGTNWLGTGYGRPDRLTIESSNDDEREAQIRSLQEAYEREYASQGIVVPLRSGVFAQIFENQSSSMGQGRREATIYNSYTPGSEEQAA